MPAPNHSVTLSPEQIEELSARLSDMRHNVNNHLSLIVAATDLIRCRPDQAARYLESLAEPPQKIANEVLLFSMRLEEVLGLARRSGAN